MCGFAGFVDFAADRGAADLERVARRMSDPLIHRGPDGYGSWVDAAQGVGMGHRRLAVIDLSPHGSQPMVSASGNLVLSFNGEIYNHTALRAALESTGHVFRGTSDTEVLVESICRWGIEETLTRVVGMFAIAVWNVATSTLTLARDRLGEKPLYYGWAGREFLFGSTLEALKKHPAWKAPLDLDVLALYFRTNYVPDPLAIYRGFRKLLPGSCLHLAVGSATVGELPEPKRYWSLLEAARRGISSPFAGDDREALEHLESLLKQSVGGQLVADVPVGAFLSGGIDSSCVVALMQQHSTTPTRTFTVGLEDAAYDESGRAAKIAAYLGTQHTQLTVTAGDLIDIVPRMPEFFDEPFGDSSQIPTALIARLARKDVTVALTGDGGDEVFCGYNRITQLKRIHESTKWIPLPIRRAISASLAAIPVSAYDVVLRRGKFGALGDQAHKLGAILGMDGINEMYLDLATQWKNPTELVLGATPIASTLGDIGNWPHDLPPLLRLMWVEASTSLPGDMLTKVDRAGMGYSLESRMPLLDHRLIEFAWSLPDRYRIRDGKSKWALRQVLDGYVPEALVDMPKSGFGIPLDEWLRGPLRDWAESLLDARRLRDQGLLDADQVRTTWQQHLDGRYRSQSGLWGVLMFQGWMETEQAATLTAQ